MSAGSRWRRPLIARRLCFPSPTDRRFRSTKSKPLLTPDVKAVFVQATETSTGVRHDVAALAKMVKGTDALLVVDAITGLGTTTFDVDGDGIDVIIGGSQKALMIPPGLAYLAASERAWARMETSKQPRYYFDLRKERKSAAKGESAYTPSVALIAAMGAALDYLEQQGKGDLAKGRDLLVANAELSALCMPGARPERPWDWSCSPPAHSAAVTAIKAPEGVRSSDLVKGFKKEFAGVLSDGQGEMKGQIRAHRAHRLSRLPGLHRHHRRNRAGACLSSSRRASSLATDLAPRSLFMRKPASAEKSNEDRRGGENCNRRDEGAGGDPQQHRSLRRSSLRSIPRQRFQRRTH